MTLRWPLFVLAVVFAALLSACGNRLPFDVSLAPTPLPAAAESDELTLAAFTDFVSSAGLNVRLRGGVSQPFFAVDGQLVDIEGESVQVFEYQAADEAQAAAAQVTPDGSAVASGDEMTRVDWVSTPHFYHRDRLIVVYVGDDDGVLDILDGTLGGPFAGAATRAP